MSHRPDLPAACQQLGGEVAADEPAGTGSDSKTAAHGVTPIEVCNALVWKTFTASRRSARP